MKIRTGFVSNSSSSSYVVLLPQGFEATVDEELKPLVNSLITDGELWMEQVAEDYDDGYDLYDALVEKVEQYVIATMDGASEDGKIVLADITKVKELIK